MRKALERISSHRKKCHEYDRDCGYELRSFDHSDVRVMEYMAREALSKQAAKKPDK